MTTSFRFNPISCILVLAGLLLGPLVQAQSPQINRHSPSGLLDSFTPIIDVSRDSIRIALSEVQDSIDLPMLIRNLGSEELFYDIQLSLEGIDVLLATTGLGQFRDELERLGARTASSTIPVTEMRLDTTEILIISDDFDPTLAEILIVQEWMSQGGGLLIDGNIDIDAYNQMITGSGILFTPEAGLPGLTLDITYHPVTSAISEYTILNPASILSVSENAISLVRDIFLRTHVAAASIGRGRVVAVCGYNIWNLDSPGHLRLALNAVGWLATGWLSTMPAVGTIAGSDSQAVSVKLNATDLFDGRYRAALHIASNDPIAPVLNVPVALAFQGVPEITVSEDTLDFGEVQLNFGYTRSVKVQSTGSDTLSVSNILSDNPEFAVNNSASLVPPLEEFTVNVTFKPSSSGVHTANLTIASNDPLTPVSSLHLSGTGIIGPSIEVTADSIDVFITGVDSTIAQLSISNSGVADLDFEVAFSDSFHGLNLMFRDERRADFRVELEQRGARTITYGGDISLSTLDTIDVFVTDDAGDLSSHEEALINDWIRTGGSLLIDDDNDTPGFNTLLQGSGISYSAGDGYDGSTANIGLHPATVNLSQYQIDNALASLFLSGSAVALIRDSLDVVHAAADLLGHGRVLAICDHSLRDADLPSEGHLLLGINAIAWLARPWLRASLPGGILPSGTSEEMELQFNSAGLIDGDFETELLIHSNDSLKPELRLPVALLYDGLPDIVLPVDSLLFEPLLLGSADTLAFFIENLGADTLHISEISSDHPDYLALPGSLSIAIQDSSPVEIIFTPTESGIHPATISIHSNDPDAPVSTVHVSGEGFHPSAIDISTDSIVAYIDGNGSIVETFSIHSTGLSPLTWQLVPAILTATQTNSLTGLRALFTWDNFETYQLHLLGRGASASVYSGILTAAILDTVDLLIINDALDATAEEVSLIHSWIIDGGGLIIDADTDTADFNAMMAGSGITYAPDPVVEGISEDIAFHALTHGITSYEIDSQSLFASLAVQHPAEAVIRDINGLPFIAAGQLGSGRVVANADETLRAHINTLGHLSLGLNAAAWAGNPWVQVTPESGFIDPGESEVISVHLDARYLTHGVYEALIKVESDDPQMPEASLPLFFHVDSTFTGVAQIAVTPDQLTFFARSDEVTSGILTIHNAGNGELVWQISDDDSIATTHILAGEGALPQTTASNASVKQARTGDGMGTMKSTGWHLNGDCSWLSASPGNGVVAPGDSVSVSVIIDAAQLLLGSYQCRLLVSSNDSSSTETIIPVFLEVVPNLPPNAEDDEVTTDENSAIDIDVLANDYDPDGDSLFIFSAGEAENGKVVFSDSATLIYIPDDFFDGTDGFYYQAGDGFGGLDSALVIINVNDVVGLTDEVANPHPEKFVLHQNSPNPFNPSTEIRYELPRPAVVNLQIYNTLGEQIISLVNEAQPAGYHSSDWNGRDHNGHQVSSGIYLYRITAEARIGPAERFVAVRKFILLK